MREMFSVIPMIRTPFASSRPLFTLPEVPTKAPTSAQRVQDAFTASRSRRSRSLRFITSCHSSWLVMMSGPFCRRKLLEKLLEPRSRTWSEM
jgi:hypothetical protein